MSGNDPRVPLEETPSIEPIGDFMRPQLGAVIRRAVDRWGTLRNAEFFDAVQAELALANCEIVRKS